ncbi:MAG: methytransferase partner Trm112 [Dehalococcoidales bacterium]|nr:methytransferase partner Trm112 [Dehalococcoidales bacterium]
MMDILGCPVCKGKLELTVTEEDRQEIAEGSLYCPQCRQRYPIADRIPNLLPPQQH